MSAVNLDHNRANPINWSSRILNKLACPARFERATSTLEGRDYEYFGNNFGNKDVVFLQTFIPPIDLAETR